MVHTEQLRKVPRSRTTSRGGKKNIASDSKKKATSTPRVSHGSTGPKGQLSTPTRQPSVNTERSFLPTESSPCLSSPFNHSESDEEDTGVRNRYVYYILLRILVCTR